MRRTCTGTLAPRAWRLAPLSLCLAALAACSSRDATAPAAVARLSLAAGEQEVVINDEEWIDRTVEVDPVDIPSGEAEGEAEGEAAPEDGFGAARASFSVAAAALAPEPIIRVGIVYSELSATSIRFGGRDGTDPFVLRNSAGATLFSGSGEVVATRLSTGPSGQFRLTLPSGATVNSGGPVTLASQSGYVRVRRTTTDASYYRGTAEVRFNSTRTFLVGVNELPIEQYLYGVVPRELGPIAFPHLEALKAQAVAARTYARRRIQFCGAARCGHGYHIIPTTGDQVYGSAGGEHPLSSQAVNDTRGVVATYNGGLVEALYSSTSGGFTANSEDVFLNALPYLRGVPDHERGQALEHVPSLDVFRRHANPTNLRNHANGDFEADWSIYHRWYVDWTAEEMRQVVGRIQLPSGTTFIDPGVVYSVTVTDRSNSGHARQIEFVTAKRGTLIARKDAIRSALRYVTYSTTGAMVLNSLRSTMVFVAPVTDPKTKALVGWEAYGGGWGHGVGMNQTGAVGMAEKGRTHQEILGHYYQNAVLEQRW